MHVCLQLSARDLYNLTIKIKIYRIGNDVFYRDMHKYGRMCVNNHLYVEMR